MQKEKKKQEDEEAITGLELGEIQVGQAALFVLGLAVGFPLFGGKQMCVIKTPVLVRLFSFDFLFLIRVALQQDFRKQGSSSRAVRSVMVPHVGWGFLQSPGPAAPEVPWLPCPPPHLHPRPPTWPPRTPVSCYGS